MERTRQHDPGAPIRRPTIIVGSRSSTFGAMTVAPDNAGASGMHGIDLDLRWAWRCPSVDDIRPMPISRIKSVWLPMQYAGPMAEQRSTRLRAFLNFAATRCGLRTIVLPKNRPVRRPGIPLGAMAQQLSNWYGLRIAVGIPADALMEQAGSHLDHVANMRRLAEEWDLDIALDLTSSAIEQWEAEAVLMRLFPRLALVRMQPWLDRDGLPLHTSPARVCMRSASMLADQTFHGTISIEAWDRSHDSWSWLGRPGLRDALQTRADILAAYDRVAQLDAARRHQLPGSGTTL